MLGAYTGAQDLVAYWGWGQCLAPQPHTTLRQPSCLALRVGGWVQHVASLQFLGGGGLLWVSVRWVAGNQTSPAYCQPAAGHGGHCPCPAPACPAAAIPSPCAPHGRLGPQEGKLMLQYMYSPASPSLRPARRWEDRYPDPSWGIQGPFVLQATGSSWAQRHPPSS